MTEIILRIFFSLQVQLCHVKKFQVPCIKKKILIQANDSYVNFENGIKNVRK